MSNTQRRRDEDGGCPKTANKALRLKLMFRGFFPLRCVVPRRIYVRVKVLSISSIFSRLSCVTRRQVLTSCPCICQPRARFTTPAENCLQNSGSRKYSSDSRQDPFPERGPCFARTSFNSRTRSSKMRCKEPQVKQTHQRTCAASPRVSQRLHSG